jgi:hypothetical protein
MSKRTSGSRRTTPCGPLQYRVLPRLADYCRVLEVLVRAKHHGMEQLPPQSWRRCGSQFGDRRGPQSWRRCAPQSWRRCANSNGHCAPRPQGHGSREGQRPAWAAHCSWPMRMAWVRWALCAMWNAGHATVHAYWCALQRIGRAECDAVTAPHPRRAASAQHPGVPRTLNTSTVFVPLTVIIATAYYGSSYPCGRDHSIRL